MSPVIFQINADRQTVYDGCISAVHLNIQSVTFIIKKTVIYNISARILLLVLLVFNTLALFKLNWSNPSKELGVYFGSV